MSEHRRNLRLSIPILQWRSEVGVHICSNLMVSDLGRSVRFYQEVLGLEVVFIVAADRSTVDDPAQGVFCMLRSENSELMLQQKESLIEEVPVFSMDQPLSATAAFYFRGIDPDTVVSSLDMKHIVREPFTQWYGMREVYITDPDGYLICAAMPVDDQEAD